MKKESEVETDEYYCCSRAEINFWINPFNVLPVFEIYIYTKVMIHINIKIGWLFIHGNYNFKLIPKKERN
jgi:hypothetical protein